MNTPVQMAGVGRVLQIDKFVLVLVSEMTYYVSSGMLNPAHSLTHSFLSTIMADDSTISPSPKTSWIFCDPETWIGYLRIVEKHDVATLILIIWKVVLPGSKVWSDEWSACCQLGEFRYIHHSHHFHDPVIRVCPTFHLDEHVATMAVQALSILVNHTSCH